MPWGQAQGNPPKLILEKALLVGTGSHHCQHPTTDPPDAQAHTRSLVPNTLGSCPSGCLGAQGSAGGMRTGLGVSGLERWGTAGQGMRDPWAAGTWVSVGASRACGRWVWGLPGCAVGVGSWYPLPSAQCPLPSAWCLLLPTGPQCAVPPPHCPHRCPYWCVVPMLVPVLGAGAQCLVHGMQCWCQWMVPVPILVSVCGPGSADSEWYHCRLCGVCCALCGAGASAQYQCPCWCCYPLPGSRANAQ